MLIKEIMINYKTEDCKDKLSKLSHDEGLKLIYTWIKQDVINLKQFKELIDFSKQAKKINHPEWLILAIDDFLPEEHPIRHHSSYYAIRKELINSGVITD